MTDHYAVVGNPVNHSLSPQIHAEFARQTGLDIDYVRLGAPLDGFERTVTKFIADGGKGVNVTLPFKQRAWKLADERHADALVAGAVNVIDVRAGRLTGYNTDGIGLLADLERNLGFALAGKHILLMGAGGAAQGVIAAILRAAPRALVIANRSMERAHESVVHFKLAAQAANAQVLARDYGQLAGSNFDLVINATSAGLSGEMPSLPAGIFAAGALAYDMVYGRTTPFMRFAEQQGVRSSDGLGMLAEQAAESFLIWRGVRPATAPVLEMLRKA